LIIYAKIAQNKSRLTGYSYGNWQGINVTYGYGVHFIMIILIIMLRYQLIFGIDRVRIPDLLQNTLQIKLIAIGTHV